MKTLLRVALVSIAIHPAFAAVETKSAPLTLVPAIGARVYLTGTSTLHPYASTSTLTQFRAVLSSGNGVESTAPADAVYSLIARRAPFQTFEVVVPVKGLKSGESGLDKNMYKALKVEKAPEIRFTMTHYDALAAEGSKMSFTAQGQLAIAGVQKDVTLTGFAVSGAEALLVEGQYELKMSDFGITPPKLLMGAIKVADPVVIHYHLPFEIKKGDIQ